MFFSISDKKIQQSRKSQINLNFKAEFYSEPFKKPFFYVYRISKWKNNKAWEIEMMHQKLYLKNPPKEIQYFSITHGFNLITINRSYKFNLFKENEQVYMSFCYIHVSKYCHEIGDKLCDITRIRGFTCKSDFNSVL